MTLRRLDDLGPRTVWDIADDAFDLYRERFALYAALSAAVHVPAQIVYTLLTAEAYGRLQTAMQRSPENALPSVFLYGMVALMGAPLLLAAQALQGGATACVVADQLNGRRTTARDAGGRVLRQAVPLFFAAMGVGVASALAGCATLGIGALFVAAFTAFVAPCLLLEGRGLAAAFHRSQALAARGLGRTIGLTLLLGTLTSLLQIGISGLVSLLFLFLPSDLVAGENVRNFQEFVTSQMASAAGGLLLAPLPGIALTLLYFDQRIRCEGLDIELRARRGGVTLAPDAFGGIAGGAPPPAPGESET